jgi:4-aminobutyrate aminotransferase
VADEVQTGMGRTGRMFASEHWDVEPDIITIGKGIASGLPMGAIVASKQTMDWPAGSHANTFGGNPVACEAALMTIQLLEKHYVANAARIGGYLMEALRSLQGRHRLIGDVRGKGLMIGVEIVRDPATKDMAVQERDDIIQRCFQKGLLLLGCGQSAIRLVPPLMITKQEANTALEILDSVLSQVEEA